MSCKWPGFLSPPAQTFLFDHRWPLLLPASEMSLTSSFCLSVYITLHLNLLRNHKKIWKYINMTLIKVSQQSRSQGCVYKGVSLILSKVLRTRTRIPTKTQFRQFAERPWRLLYWPTCVLSTPHLSHPFNFPRTDVKQSETIYRYASSKIKHVYKVSRKRIWR